MRPAPLAERLTRRALPQLVIVFTICAVLANGPPPSLLD